jgi:hypothetical protein
MCRKLRAWWQRNQTMRMGPAGHLQQSGLQLCQVCAFFLQKHLVEDMFIGYIQHRKRLNFYSPKKSET